MTDGGVSVSVTRLVGDLRWVAGPPVGGDMVAGVRPQPPTA